MLPLRLWQPFSLRQGRFAVLVLFFVSFSNSATLRGDVSVNQGVVSFLEGPITDFVGDLKNHVFTPDGRVAAIVGVSNSVNRDTQTTDSNEYRFNELVSATRHSRELEPYFDEFSDLYVKPFTDLQDVFAQRRANRGANFYERQRDSVSNAYKRMTGTAEENKENAEGIASKILPTGAAGNSAPTSLAGVPSKLTGLVGDATGSRSRGDATTGESLPADPGSNPFRRAKYATSPPPQVPQSISIGNSGALRGSDIFPSRKGAAQFLDDMDEGYDAFGDPVKWKALMEKDKAKPSMLGTIDSYLRPKTFARPDDMNAAAAKSDLAHYTPKRNDASALSRSNNHTGKQSSSTLLESPVEAGSARADTRSQTQMILEDGPRALGRMVAAEPANGKDLTALPVAAKDDGQFSEMRGKFDFNPTAWLPKRRPSEEEVPTLSEALFNAAKTLPDDWSKRADPNQYNMFSDPKYVGSGSLKSPSASELGGLHDKLFYEGYEEAARVNGDLIHQLLDSISGQRSDNNVDVGDVVDAAMQNSGVKPAGALGAFASANQAAPPFNNQRDGSDAASFGLTQQQPASGDSSGRPKGAELTGGSLGGLGGVVSVTGGLGSSAGVTEHGAGITTTGTLSDPRDSWGASNALEAIKTAMQSRMQEAGLVGESRGFIDEQLHRLRGAANQAAWDSFKRNDIYSSKFFSSIVNNVDSSVERRNKWAGSYTDRLGGIASGAVGKWFPSAESFKPGEKAVQAMLNSVRENAESRLGSQVGEIDPQVLQRALGSQGATFRDSIDVMNGAAINWGLKPAFGEFKNPLFKLAKADGIAESGDAHTLDPAKGSVTGVMGQTLKNGEVDTEDLPMVRLRGLQTAPEFNGMPVRIVSVPGNDRLQVRLENGAELQVKPENLEPPSLPSVPTYDPTHGEGVHDPETTLSRRMPSANAPGTGNVKPRTASQEEMQNGIPTDLGRASPATVKETLPNMFDDMTPDGTTTTDDGFFS